MRTFLNIICVALSIYYVFAAPTHAPTDTGDVKQIIDELHNLTSADLQEILTPTLCRNETSCLQNVTIEEVSCRAQDSFRTIKSNFTEKLKILLKTFTKVRKVGCTFSHEKTEIDQEDLRNAIERLLTVFKKHLSNLSISKSD